MLALERTRLVLATGTVSAVLVIISGLTVIPAFGTMGAALGRAALQLGAVGATLWCLNVRLSCRTPFAASGRIIAAPLMCAAVAAACTRLVAGPAGIVVAIAAGVAAYGLAVRLLNALPRSDTGRLIASLAVLPAPVRAPAATTLRLLCRNDQTIQAAA